MTQAGDWLVPAELDAVLVDKGHNALLGQRYHAHGDGWIEMRMPWHERLVGNLADGAMARGPILTLLDNCAGVAIWLRRGGILPQVTLDLRVDWLRPGAPGADLICRCECLDVSPTMAFARGLAYEATPDDPLCFVSAAYALL